MKKFTIILTALLFSTVSIPVFAKKNQKPEIKAWKQRKDDMHPLQLKDLVEENHRLKTSNQQLEEKVKASQEEIDQLVKLKMKIKASSKQQGNQGPGSPGEVYWGEEGMGPDGSQGGSGKPSEYYEAQGMVGPDGFSKNDWAIDENGQFYIKGLMFKVQIGAYKKRDLSNVLEVEKPQESFGQEQSEGINMYTLRHFRDYWKANQFKKELRAMGLKDAWIVAFKDGKRVPLKEVLQEVIKQKKQ